MAMLLRHKYSVITGITTACTRVNNENKRFYAPNYTALMQFLCFKTPFLCYVYTVLTAFVHMYASKTRTSLDAYCNCTKNVDIELLLLTTM